MYADVPTALFLKKFNSYLLTDIYDHVTSWAPIWLKEILHRFFFSYFGMQVCWEGVKARIKLVKQVKDSEFKDCWGFFHYLWFGFSPLR